MAGLSAGGVPVGFGGAAIFSAEGVGFRSSLVGLAYADVHADHGNFRAWSKIPSPTS